MSGPLAEPVRVASLPEFAPLSGLPETTPARFDPQAKPKGIASAILTAEDDGRRRPAFQRDQPVGNGVLGEPGH
jgi:hypothetical protein